MSVKVNGTHAKDIALHFLEATTDERLTPAVISKTIRQAKNLLSYGYAKDEIIRVIDAIIEKGIHMYSLGYVNACINDVLKELEELDLKQKGIEEKKLLEQHAMEKRSEVVTHGESTERNRDKAGRFGVQSRFGKKHNFDMFEGQ